MKFNASGIVRLKPFDESEDSLYTEPAAYAGLLLLPLSSAQVLISLAAVFLTLTGSEWALPIYGVGIAIGAIISGLQWEIGLKARSLNDLFASLFFTIPLLTIFL